MFLDDVASYIRWTYPLHESAFSPRATKKLIFNRKLAQNRIERYNMDPVTALGLASNVVQFVQFASDLVKTAIEVRRSSSGCTADILTLDTLYGQLNDFNAELLSGRDNASSYLNGPGSKSDKNATSFRTLSLLCQSDCEKLLLVVRKLQVQDGSRGRWQSFRTALKSLWEKEDIRDLERRLQRTQMTMTFHICALARCVYCSIAGNSLS